MSAHGYAKASFDHKEGVQVFKDKRPPTFKRVVELRELVSSWRGPGTLVLVTHALTVGRLARLFPEQAETLVLQPTPGSRQGGSLVGRIAPPR